MRDFLGNKLVTILVVVATVILALVSTFTAWRLYKLRQISISPISPESKPLALEECVGYNYFVSREGVVSVRNDSLKEWLSHEASVYINGIFITTVSVPALSPGNRATLGTVQIPGNGISSWMIMGAQGCSNSGTFDDSMACRVLSFSLKETPTPTPRPFVTLTPTTTPTPIPSLTPTPTTKVSITPTPTSSISPISTLYPQVRTPTPTPSQGALPQAGVSSPTILTLILGITSLFFFALLF